MHYVISDIHGQITEFKNLLEKIDFDGIRDKMIIAGDVLDRGNYGIELIKYIEIKAPRLIRFNDSSADFAA